MQLSGSSAAAEILSSPERKPAPYIFHGQTTSLCETCLVPVPAKIIIEDEAVYYLKRCRDHGVQKTLIADDVDYWRAQKLWLKPGDRPLTAQTRTEAGCPFDCGLCPDHEQHSCLAIVEINSACNLACPVCFADADNFKQPTFTRLAGNTRNFAGPNVETDCVLRALGHRGMLLSYLCATEKIICFLR